MLYTENISSGAGQGGPAAKDKTFEKHRKKKMYLFKREVRLDENNEQGKTDKEYTDV